MIKKNSLVVIIILLLSVFNCGKKGPLVLEPPLIPTAVEDFQVLQVGDSLKLMWSFPQAFTDKKKTPFEVEEVDKIYIYYSEKEIPGDKFRKKASVLKKLTLTDLTKAPIALSLLKSPLGTSSSSNSPSTRTTNNRKFRNLSYYITIPFKLDQLDSKDHFIAIQYYFNKKRSPLSEVVYVHSIPPVKAVTDIKVTQENKLIKLTWARPTMDEKGNTISSIAGYNIYRKVEPEKTEETPVSLESLEAEPPAFIRLNKDNILMEYYEDTDSGINGVYSYYISAIVSNQVETAPSQINTVNITDIFPPEIPANLVCFRAPDHLFLTWRPSSDTDLAYYRVYRTIEDEEGPKVIADKITTTSYKDTNVQKGKSYFYTVSAVDLKGNESEQSNEVKEQF